MRRALRPLLLALAALAACTRDAAIEPIWKAGPTPEDARESYVRACASCHGADGRGARPEDPKLEGHVPDLTLLAERHGGVFPRQYVIDVMTGEVPIPAHGDHGMPVWRQRFGPDSGATAAAAFYARRRLELLADHMQSLQRLAAP